jgi:hypothetical protein
MAPMITLEPPQPDPTETLELDAQPIIPDPVLITAPSPEINGCVWEEKLPGLVGVRRCNAPAAPGRVWCARHAAAFAAGKSLQGRTRRAIG